MSGSGAAAGTTWWLWPARFVTLAMVIGLVLLTVAARRRGGSIVEWQGALLSTEFGHWIAVAAVLGAAGWTATWSLPAVRWGGLGLCLLMGALFLEPAIRASRMVDDFSWVRLWCPLAGPDVRGVTVEKQVYRRAGILGPDLEVLICIPGGTAERLDSRPWVVSIHGGGWNGGKADDFLNWDRELAAHGFVVLMPDYRLAPEHPWPAQREDIRDLVAWARERSDHLGINPDNLTLLGRSAGGQIASACAFGDPAIEAARVAAFYAPHDLYFARDYAREDDVLDSLKLLRDYLGGDPELKGENYETGSAIRLVTEASPETLLIHGTRDTLVWVEQSRRLARRMEEVGASARLVELPWATHACDYFPGSPGGQVMMSETLRFLK